MAGLLSTLGLVALIGLGVWLFGSFALRLGGLIMFFAGLILVITGQPEGLITLVLGAVAWLGGHWLYGFKHGFYKSTLAAKLLKRAPLRRPGPGPVLPEAGTGDFDEPCTTGKVRFPDEDAALAVVERNQDRYARGLEERYRLERAYVCEFCDWWHVTSQAERR